MSRKSLASEYADRVEMEMAMYLNRCSLKQLLEVAKVALGDDNPDVKGLAAELKSK